MSSTPLRYEPSFEMPDPDEAETTSELVETMRGIIETTSRDYGHAMRSVHAKSHGLLRGEMRVLDGLPETLAQGVFAKPATYPVVLRFSTNPGDILPDSVSTPRGLALKLLGVEGARLPDAAGTTQDFVLVDAPAFTAATPKAFLGTLKTLAKTTDKAEGLKKVLSAVLRGTEAAVEAVGGETGTLKAMGGHPATNMLGETYYSVVPFLYGPYMAKLSVAPVSPALLALQGAKLTLHDHPDALRNALTAFFAADGGEWEVRIQLCTDLASMPIEDASVRWPEAASPYLPVARLSVGPQPAWTEARSRAVDDGMSFSPWHGLAAHRPLGGIMRSRKPAYEMSANLRATYNRCPIHEPASLDAALTRDGGAVAHGRGAC